MVAGRRFWGRNEERSPQHQPGSRSDLGVEAVVEHGLGTGEAIGRGADVLATREVDEEDDQEAEQAQPEDDPPDTTPSSLAQCEESEGGGEQRNRNQEVGVRLTGGLGVDGRRACRRQAGVARLADFNCPVVDELGDDQAGCGGDDGQADRALGREQAAAARRNSLRPAGQPQQTLFEQRQAPQENDGAGAEAAAGAPRPTSQ
jgi:hypothetical protein